MPCPEKALITILKEQGVDFTCSLPCEKIEALLRMVSQTFFHVPLTREEEGVGICAGAALSAKRPAMFVQSSGLGNMINAMLSLTEPYKLPLALFVSRRGVYKEKIAAQVPMGLRLPSILRGAKMTYSVIDTRDHFGTIGKKLSEVYKRNKIHAFLLSPSIWEKIGCRVEDTVYVKRDTKCRLRYTPRNSPLAGGGLKGTHASQRRLTRFEVLKAAAPYLDSKVVVCNLGFPSKELFHIKHRPSNFYMLGSMGMATPIGLGIALTSHKQVVVIDGDGSLLMNPGTLATAAHLGPENLTILAVDNSSYGSTGNQPTLTGSCVDLEVAAKGLGIKNTIKVSGRREIIDVLKSPQEGLRFIHVLAVPGNRDVPNIPLDYLEIKKGVQDFLRAG